MKEKASIDHSLSLFSFERWGYAKDIALIYLLLVGIEYFLLGFGTYNTLPIHPFWIAVILISSHHGTASGLLSAIVGIILLQFSFLGSTEHLTSDADYYQLALERWGQPILWFIAAVFLGELRHNTLKKFTQAREKIALLSLQNKTMTSYCDDLQTLTQTLEHKISVQDQQASPYLLEKLRQIGTIPEEQLKTTLPVLMEELFGSVQFSLYEKKSDRFVKTVQFGQKTSSSQNATRITNQSGTKLPAHIQKISDHPTFLSALNQKDSAALGQTALFSGPVFKYNPKQNKNILAGVLSVEMLEAERINTETALLFQLVCTQLAHSLTITDQKHILISASEKAETLLENH